MDTIVYNNWINMHEDPDACNTLSEALCESWQESNRYNIDYENALPLQLTEEEYRIAKTKSRRLYVYSSSIVRALEQSAENDNFAVAIFDNDGCLLMLFKKPSFEGWLNSNHIKKGTVWDEKIIGTNIFSFGKKLVKKTKLIGEENYSKFLINTACYYAPIMLERKEILGSVVVITAYEDRSPYLLNLVNSLSRLLELQAFWFDITEVSTGIIDGYGIISLDQSVYQNRVLTMSKEVFKMMGIAHRDLYYDQLESIIEDSPLNAEFYNIINHKRIVNDKIIRIYVNNKQVSLNISTYLYKEEHFHMDGMVIALNSIKRINNLMSQYALNTARLTFDDIIGNSRKYTDILKRCLIAASSNSNILLLGESGVGKDIIAQAIHNASTRRGQPFVAVNCASFSKELISSDLFGYEEGAFTGARKGGSIGKFELANNGTLFLDEIGDMPLDIQAFLLRVIEEKCFTKIGGNTLINVDVRIIAATNKNLKLKIEQGLFREDLFYRLGIIRVTIPPLRERTEDIILLADHFIMTICERINRPKVRLSAEAMDFFKNYTWPGNTRELQNLLEGIISTKLDDIIQREDIINYLAYDDINFNAARSSGITIETRLSEKEQIEKVLLSNKYNKSKTAKDLGISRRTLYRKLSEYKIT